MRCHNTNGWAACTRAAGMICAHICQGHKRSARIFSFVSAHLNKCIHVGLTHSLWPFVFLHLLSVAELFLRGCVVLGSEVLQKWM